MLVVWCSPWCNGGCGSWVWLYPPWPWWPWAWKYSCLLMFILIIIINAMMRIGMTLVPMRLEKSSCWTDVHCYSHNYHHNFHPCHDEHQEQTNQAPITDASLRKDAISFHVDISIWCLAPSTIYNTQIECPATIFNIVMDINIVRITLIRIIICWPSTWIMKGHY